MNPPQASELNNCRVAVIVLNWNGWKDSLACLNSLGQAVEQGLCRIVIVDNASADNSVGMIREWLKSTGRDFVESTEGEQPPRWATRYAVIHARQNRGYAAGNNLGIKFALSRGDIEYVFLLNNDATVEPACISQLIAWADRDPTIGIVGTTLIEDDGKLRIAAGNRYNLLLTTTRPAIVTHGKCEGRLDYVAGAAQFIRVSALRIVGLLSEDYFLYFEELDLTRRITKAGFIITWCPAGIVYHLGGRSAGSRSGANKTKSALAEYHSNLSCLIFMRKFHARLLWIAAPIRFALKICHDLTRRQPALVFPLMRAYLDYVAWARRYQA